MNMLARHQRGVSLIELMIALLIGTLLLLGLVQVFAASHTAYQISEGLARVQENGRFAVDYLQRDIRMAGHFGCVNDQARKLSTGITDPLLSHLAGTDSRIDFGTSIQGYEAVGTAPAASGTPNNWNLATTAGTWSPVLPDHLTKLANPPLAGSDVIVLRYFSGEGIPVTAITSVPGKTTITVNPAQWSVLTQGGVASPSLFGVSDCSYADIFQATSVAAGTVVFEPSKGLNSATDFTERYTASPAGQTVLYRAESLAYYVAKGTDGEPALYRLRFNPAPGGGLGSGQAPEELVAGIESLQFLYGQDANPVDSLNGNITEQNTATPLATTEDKWRRVGLVQLGVLARSPTRASATAAASDATVPTALGVSFKLDPYDARYRTVYESTVALRNRLYGN